MVKYELVLRSIWERRLKVKKSLDGHCEDLRALTRTDFSMCAGRPAAAVYQRLQAVSHLPGLTVAPNQIAVGRRREQPPSSRGSDGAPKRTGSGQRPRPRMQRTVYRW